MSGVELTPREVTAKFGAMVEGWGARTVTCQCDQHPRQPCTAPAVMVVHCHLLHACDTLDTDEFGNRVELLCEACARHLWVEAHDTVRALREAAARAGRVSSCQTCGAPIVNPSDLMRSVTRPTGGVR